MMMTTQIHIYIKIYGEFVPKKKKRMQDVTNDNNCIINESQKGIGKKKKEHDLRNISNVLIRCYSASSHLSD